MVVYVLLSHSIWLEETDIHSSLELTYDWFFCMLFAHRYVLLYPIASEDVKMYSTIVEFSFMDNTTMTCIVNM